MGLEVGFEQVEVDTSKVPEFHVAEQDPDSGSLVKTGDQVRLKFNCPGMLRYWDDWALPLLGDLRNQVGYYRVTRPPEAINIPGAEYPDELRKCDFSGAAGVEALVDFDGSVIAARVSATTEYDAADSAACDAALRARFSPAEHHDRPVRVWVPLRFSFEHHEVEPLLPSPTRPEPTEP